MNVRRIVLLALLVSVFATWPLVVLRADSTEGTGGGLVGRIGCDQTTIVNGEIGVNRACQVDDFINAFVILSQWGISILAVLAVLMLIYGGFQFITAGGRASKVDEGKRIMAGTVIGTIIALSAFVIINTAVSAITGTKTSTNPFGAIGTVFGGKADLTRIFSGKVQTGGQAAGAACRQATSDWDRSCDPLQVHCADSGISGGPITTLQEKLNTLGCNCGAADGCFGKLTVACVRQFQIANLLPATGVIDATTQDRITGGSGTKSCGAASAQDAAVVGFLPETTQSTAAGSDSGCCVVRKDGRDLYCVDQVSTRACGALGADNQFIAGNCGSDFSTAGRCGSCSSVPNPSSSNGAVCFQTASPAWCSDIGHDLSGNPLTFIPSGCDGRCSFCAKTILQVPQTP